MKIKFKSTLFWLIIMAFSPVFSQRTIVADEQQWVKVSETNYADVLELIAMRAKANYEEISSWQGRMDIRENIHFYGTNAAEKSHGVNPDDIARNSQHICRAGTTVAEFVVDMHNDKLYSNVDPNLKYKAIDLDYNIPADQYKGRPARTRTILTPESYTWYLTDGKFHSETQKGPAGKMVFIESSQNENVKEFVRDPRIYFNSSGEGRIKLWESLLQNLRNKLSETLNVRIAGYPHIEILSMNTGNGIKYRIMTTWQKEKYSSANYIRCLLEVDESVGFNATKTETTNPNGVKTDLIEYTYEKIGEIFLPKTVKKQVWNREGKPTFTSEVTIETTGVNKPLPEDTFTIKNLGVGEGTLVTDKIKKAEFRFSKGDLVPLSEPNNQPMRSMPVGK